MNIFLMFIDVMSANGQICPKRIESINILRLTQWINLSCRLAKASKRIPVLIKTFKVYLTRIIVCTKASLLLGNGFCTQAPAY